MTIHFNDKIGQSHIVLALKKYKNRDEVAEHKT